MQSYKLYCRPNASPCENSDRFLRFPQSYSCVDLTLATLSRLCGSSRRHAFPSIWQHLKLWCLSGG